MLEEVLRPIAHQVCYGYGWKPCSKCTFQVRFPFHFEYYLQRAFRSFHAELEHGATEDKHSDSLNAFEVITTSFDSIFAKTATVEQKVAFLKEVR